MEDFLFAKAINKLKPVFFIFFNICDPFRRKMRKKNIMNISKLEKNLQQKDLKIEKSEEKTKNTSSRKLTLDVYHAKII